METVLVTGGAGFIGSHYVDLLMDTGRYHVIVVDRLSTGGLVDNIAHHLNKSNFMFIQEDIRKIASLLRSRTQPRYIVHFAAETHVDRSIRYAKPFIESNVEGTLEMLEIARFLPDLEKFVYISTDEVYGSAPFDYSFKETDVTSPKNPYSATKLAGEALAIAYHNTYKVPVVITRSSNNFGTRQYPEKLIPLFVSQLKRDETIGLYGRGLQRRDWLHVDDNCIAVDLVRQYASPGEIYNIGADNEHANIDIALMLLEIMGKSEHLIRFVIDRPGHDARYAIDSSKLRNKFGWYPKRTVTLERFKDSLREVVESYK